TQHGPGSPDAIHITLPAEYYRLPLGMVVGGSVLGMFRGGRRESWRFLAENAHRAPTTMQGWYFYQKTKNYRVMLGALKGGGADGLRLGLTGLGWVGFEELMRRTGLDDVREIGAGVGTASVFAGIYRLPWRAARQAMLLGLITGTTLRILRYSVESTRERAKQAEAAE
ncbi:hypothetical protein M422DRAFT_138814, partial [Sphaerobolus stellatus SS14]